MHLSGSKWAPGRQTPIRFADGRQNGRQTPIRFAARCGRIVNPRGEEYGAVSEALAGVTIDKIDKPGRLDSSRCREIVWVSHAGQWLAPLTLATDHLGDVPCQNGRRASDKGLLSMSLDEYLKLLDLVGRQARSDKRGAIPAELATILERLGIHSGQLVESVEKLTQRFPRMIGPAEQMAARAAEAGRHWFQGKRHAERTFSNSGSAQG